MMLFFLILEYMASTQLPSPSNKSSVSNQSFGSSGESLGPTCQINQNVQTSLSNKKELLSSTISNLRQQATPLIAEASATVTNAVSPVLTEAKSWLSPWTSRPDIILLLTVIIVVGV